MIGKRTNGNYWLMAGLVASAIILIFVADSLTRTTLRHFEISSFMDGQTENRYSIQERIESLRLENTQLRTLLAERPVKYVPTLETVQHLAQEFAITVRRAEQLNKVDSTKEITRGYGLVFQGAPDRLLAFLKAVDERLLCTIERLSIQPATKNGSRLSATTILFVKEL